MSLRLEIFDRSYTEWKWFDVDTEHETESHLNPLELKLFSGDIVDSSGEIMMSEYRNRTTIPGVLVIDGKTYGRIKNKIIYKCIPDDIRLPSFLIPYDHKTNTFCKKKTNKYIVFRINEWTDKHPVGTIVNTLGEVDDIDSFCEYQLYCKSLNNSIQRFNKAVSGSLKKLSHNPPFDKLMNEGLTKDRTHQTVFTIDPNGCQDFDDAVGIVETHKGWILSIYIADVVAWIDYLQLWDDFTERVSTIYLPDRKRPLLPTMLSDKLCSLHEGKRRLATAMDLHIDYGKITKIEYSNVLINVYKNYEYEQQELLARRDYKSILTITKMLCDEYRYIDNVSDSHDVVAFCMIMMNHEVSKSMMKHNDGIYRCAMSGNIDNIPKNISPDVKNFAKIWNCSAGQYTSFDEIQSHDLIGCGLKSYLHITSPIRRLVDLLNMIILQHHIVKRQPSAQAMTFYKTWINKLDFINKTMRSIRKVQNDCSLLSMYITDTLDESYTGYIMDKENTDNERFIYAVYLPVLKMISHITIDNNLERYSTYRFTIHLFMDEAKLKRKVRLQLL